MFWSFFIHFSVQSVLPVCQGPNGENIVVEKITQEKNSQVKMVLGNIAPCLFPHKLLKSYCIVLWGRFFTAHLKALLPDRPVIFPCRLK